MKLMQQYIMVQGKLQPALKYIAPNPMFNRYHIQNSNKQEYEEIMTYPTVTGDLRMKNQHQGVNFDDRDIPQKTLPKEEVEPEKVVDLQGMLSKLQKKSINYNKKYYQAVKRKDMRAVSPDLLQDPRNLSEIEQENIDLKEHFIRQLQTLEEYLVVAQMWYA